MLLLRNEDGHSWPRGRVGQLPLHLEGLGKHRKFCAESRVVKGKILEIPLHAHEEEAEIGVLMLIGMQDVGAVPVQETGNAGYDALAVGAVNQKNSGIWHERYKFTCTTCAGAKPLNQVAE